MFDLSQFFLFRGVIRRKIDLEERFDTSLATALYRILHGSF